MRQRTLQREVEIAGVGLHSGQSVRLRLLPGAPDTGVVIERVDLSPPLAIAAHVHRVVDTQLCTTLGHNHHQVATVEHLLAALSGLGVDNVRVLVDGPEVPIMDGSAAPFVHLIQAAGLQSQAAPKQFLRILREVGVTEGDKCARFLPYHGFKVAFTIDFEQPVFRGRSARAAMHFSAEQFIDEVCRARTFGFMHEVEYLRSKGLARGGSFDNAIVVDDYRILNEEGLRSEDEFVQHKVLDAIGDLSLAGYSIIGQFDAYKSGHRLNTRAVATLLDTPDAWELVAFNDTEQVPIDYQFPATGALS